MNLPLKSLVTTICPLPLNLYAMQILPGESCEQYLACNMRKSNLSKPARATATSSLKSNRRYTPSNALK